MKRKTAIAALVFLCLPGTVFAFDLKEIDNPLIELVIILSAFTLIPAVLIMFTSFTRIVVVLSFLRQAIGGGQHVVPTPVIIGMSLFLTLFIMTPTVESITEDAVNPYISREITLSEALSRAAPAVKRFMIRQTREKDIELFLRITKKKAPKRIEDIPLSILVPAFSISELRTAFEIGFLIYLPFLIIDMVITSILLSMGMMMLPPVLVSIPFKLMLFVLVDGWNLVVGSIVRSFA